MAYSGGGSNSTGYYNSGYDQPGYYNANAGATTSSGYSTAGKQVFDSLSRTSVIVITIT